MRSLDNHILKILSNNDVTFFIPPYQRNYEWDEEMCGILFKDIEKVTNSRNTQHFFGTVIYYAYKLKEILKDIEGRYDPAKHYKVINTGTIDKFSSRWGIKQMTYLKDKYLGPVVLKNVFHKLFPNSYGDKPLKKKLIIKGLTLLDCTLDINGEYVPGKTTIIVASENINLLYYLSVLLNSNISQFYITQKYSSASYNGGVNFTKDMINNFPLPDAFINDLCFRFFANALLFSRSNECEGLYKKLYEVANAVVYEIYFQDRIKAINADVLKHLTNLSELKDDLSDEKKLKTIEKVYQELSDPKHPVAIAMERQKTVEEVRIIEGLDK